MPVCPSICLSARPSVICLCVRPSIRLCLRPSVCASLNQTMHLSVCLSIHLAFPSIHPSIWLSVSQSNRPACESVHPSVRVSVPVGVLMWEVFSEGRMPYEHNTNTEVVEALATGLRLPRPRLAPDALYLLMEGCWRQVGKTQDI